MRYLYSWSGGKDSTAAIILSHIHNLPPSTVIFSEVMFDKKRGISGELPEHIDFIKNRAIPVFEEWGYTVEILHATKDYLDCFHQIITKSKNPLRNGRKSGFPIGGMCTINSRIKIKAIQDYLKNVNGGFVQYVGIAADEPARLTRLEVQIKYHYLPNMAILNKWLMIYAASMICCPQYISITKGAVVGSVLTRLTASLHI